MYSNRRKCCCAKNYQNNTMNNSINNSFMQDNVDDIFQCKCGFNKPSLQFPANPMYGQSYVPIQTMNKTYLPNVGLKQGSLFPELVMPYMPYQSLEENAFIKAMNEPGKGCNK